MATRREAKEYPKLIDFQEPAKRHEAGQIVAGHLLLMGVLRVVPHRAMLACRIIMRTLVTTENHFVTPKITRINAIEFNALPRPAFLMCLQLAIVIRS